MSGFSEDRAIRIYESGPADKRITYLGANMAYFALCRDRRITDFLAGLGKQFGELPFTERPAGSESLGHISVELPLGTAEVTKLGDLCLEVLADGQFDNGAGYVVIDNRTVLPQRHEDTGELLQDGPVIAPDPSCPLNEGFGDFWPAGGVRGAA